MMIPDFPAHFTSHLSRLGARPALPGDRPLLRRIITLDTENMLEDVPADARRMIVAVQAEGRLNLARRGYPAATCLLLEAGEEVVGLVMVDLRRGLALLLELIILPPWRGQGYGREALAGLCAQADAGGWVLEASVFYDSPVRRFFHKAGFVPSREEGLELVLLRHPAGRKGAAG
ncbi:GNAT family N-acetyltransferase [Niveispirillum irakense]|uniref:GNAT family N-acetyltransferase n=1 Tax=Niveispirillum irakense TaxID=34011 RepID=UPI0003FF5257|nr:GNAT family N-acetyltransferase [Niveispirillum irakense]